MNKSDLESAVVSCISAVPELAHLQVKSTVLALYPFDHNINNPVGSILVSWNGTEFQSEKFSGVGLGRTTNIRVALGVRSVVADSSILYNLESAVFSAIAYKKLFPGSKPVIPVNSKPMSDRVSDSVFWIELNFRLFHFFDIL